MAPLVVLLFSGKRKSGKDFLTDQLKERLGTQCEIIKISLPIKAHWAKEKKLNLNELLSDNKYKEQYRRDMIEWSEEMRQRDYSCFCEAACLSAQDRPIWIVSDIRRRTDILWFQENYGEVIKKIRVRADEKTRVKRGYQFTAGVDDAQSECDLDNYADWDLIVDNSDTGDWRKELTAIINLLPKL